MVKGIGGAALAAALAGSVLGSGPAAAQAPAQGAYSGNAVKIGILNDQSGLYAEFGGSRLRRGGEDGRRGHGRQGRRRADRDRLGRPPEQARHRLGIARQWYDRDGVDAIMELTTSSVALAVQGLSKEKKKITITTGAASSDLTGKACTPYAATIGPTTPMRWPSARAGP